MIQSTFLMDEPRPLHVAIIMDGNGRWATARSRPRASGHAEGARAVRRTVEAAARLRIGTLTLYAFSGDNWRRPDAEVRGLMRLFRRYLLTETARCVETGVRLTVIGRRDRIPAALREAIEAAEAATVHGRTLRLRIALDYSARDALVRAAAAGPRPATRDELAARLGEVDQGGEAALDVDLLVRTGGEQRLSDFLLWECAYAELLFVPTMWPDFTAADLERAVREFHGRDRRFGALSGSRAG